MGFLAGVVLLSVRDDVMDEPDDENFSGEGEVTYLDGAGVGMLGYQKA